MGSGDFACVSYSFQERNVATYVKEKTAGHLPIVIPRGETFGNLHGRENHYAVYSTASNSAGSPEAVLEVHFMSRDVPLFQFAAFYDKDLEILPSPDMSIEGPIHSNGDLYLGSDNTLDITHPVTAAGNLYRGRKDADSCMTGPVQVNDPDNLVEIPTCSGSRQSIVQSDVTAWNQMINVDVTPLTAPPPEALDPVAGSTNWDHADLRVVLDLNSTPAIEIRNQDGSVDAGLSAALNACGAVGYSTTLENKREGSFIDMLDVEVDLLIDCVHASSLMGGSGLDDTSDGGLVWYFTVDGPDSSVPNSYGVRVKDGTELVSSIGGAPVIEGMTVVTDQALYVQGNYKRREQETGGVPGRLDQRALQRLERRGSAAAALRPRRPGHRDLRRISRGNRFDGWRRGKRGAGLRRLQRRARELPAPARGLVRRDPDAARLLREPVQPAPRRRELLRGHPLRRPDPGLGLRGRIRRRECPAPR